MTDPEIPDLVAQAAGHDPELTEAALRELARRQAHAVRPCSVDGEPLPLTEYGQDLSRDDGLRRQCKRHAAEQEKARYYRRLAYVHGKLPGNSRR